jgi:AcrR family transcriptional regulator
LSSKVQLEKGQTVMTGQEPTINVITQTARRRSDAVANRQRVLESAETLFASNDIADVSMGDIAAAAGVGKGTLYRCFANKGELCIALMDEELRDFQNNVFAEFQMRQGASGLDHLVYFLGAVVRFFDRHTQLMLEAQQHGVRLQTRGEINQTSIHGWFHQTVMLLVQRAQREGSVSADSDAAYLADLILAPLNPVLFRHQRQVIGLSLDDMSHNLCQFVLHGIAQSR